MQLGLDEAANGAPARRREDVQSARRVSAVFKANSLIEMFRSDAMALLHLVDLIGDQLHGEIINEWRGIT